MSLRLLTTVLAIGFGCSDGSPSNPNIDGGGQAAADATNGNDGGASNVDAPRGNNVVPVVSADLFAYLQANNYSGFAAEAAPHATAGPHDTMVRSYFNSSLDTSIRSGGSSHPIGSAVVKELMNAGGTLTGWAVMVKTARAGAAGDWYFYEVLSTTTNNPVANGNGAGGCAGCHAVGTDYIRSPYPN